MSLAEQPTVAQPQKLVLRLFVPLGFAWAAAGSLDQSGGVCRWDPKALPHLPVESSTCTRFRACVPSLGLGLETRQK